jgi:putative glycosyltransferase (TIGR04372 family)
MRVSTIRPEAQIRIGHMIDEAFIAMCWISEGTIASRVVIAPFIGRNSSNPEVAKRLNSTLIHVPKLRVTNYLLSAIADLPLLQLPTLNAVIDAPCQVLGRNPSDYPPLFTDKPHDGSARLEVLRALGLVPTLPYVCLHVRSEGYSAVDDPVQDHRNADIRSFLPAVDWLVDRGFQVIRVGGPFGGRLAESETVRDYAYSRYRSPLNDYLLSSGCAFFVGSTSGLYALASMHDRPVLGLNMSPLNAFGMLGAKTMSIPKLVYSQSLERLLTFREAASSPTGNALGAPGLREGMVLPVENTSEEILEAVKDFLSLAESPEWKLTNEEQEEQKLFESMIPDQGYGALSATMIAPSFLRRHWDLLH